jgi:adenosylcobinamide-GDP ribazoletransferase
VPSARSAGFGAIVADGVAPVAVVAWTLAVLALGAALAVAAAVPLGWVVGPQIVALLAGYAGRRHLVRRLGGVTGDVFGALIECATTVVLAGVALR